MTPLARLCHELSRPLSVLSSPTGLALVGRAGRLGDFPRGRQPGGGDRRTGKCLAGGQPAEPRFVVHCQSLRQVAAHSAQQFSLPRLGPQAREYRRRHVSREDSLPVLRAAKTDSGRPIPGRQIDYVVYSSDFPWGIRIDEDIKNSRPCWRNTEQGEKDEKPAAKPPALDELLHAGGLDQWADLSVGAGDDRQLLCPPAMQLVRPHRSAGTGQGTDLGILQCHGLRSAWRGGNRSGTPLLVVDDAGRDVRPRQYAG